MVRKLKKRFRELLEAQQKGFANRFIAEARKELLFDSAEAIRYEAAEVKLLLLKNTTPKDLTDVGFRVYSQFDEDGIIQHLIQQVPLANDTFVEIGIEDYRESNTRYLLEKRSWVGHIIDAIDTAPKFLESSRLMGLRTIHFHQAFVTIDNINSLLEPAGNDFALLSLDIDGNDYWVWKAVSQARPRILILEYNATFGPTAAISTPYKPDFTRTQHHFSNLCFGCSLAAWEHLCTEKGYRLIGTSSGHNAFFVREDIAGALPKKTAQECYREMRFRDSRGPNFEHTYLSTTFEKRRAIADTEVVDVRTNESLKIANVFPEVRS